LKMKYDCYPCIFRQSLESARMVTDDDQKLKSIMSYFGEVLQEAVEAELSAPQIAAKMQKYIKEISGNDDPYLNFKEENIKQAQKLLPLVREEIKSAADPLLAALLMAAMGNSIDAGVSLNVDIKDNIDQALDNSFAHSDYQRFVKELKSAEKLLIIADNTGEALFDKLLLEELRDYNLDIIYAVREIPILNDITKKKALEIGIGEDAEIIKSGTTAPGMIMEDAGREFMNAYQKADIVISKGQGNLEGLLDIENDIYFLLKAKCEIIAEVLEVKKDDFIFLYR